MRQREIAGTPLALTELGFGAAPIGNMFRETDPLDAQAAIDAAWDAGIRYFDTAPHYGLGLSERRVGAALAGRPRDQYVVSSKVGRLLVPNENPKGLDDDGFIVPDDVRRQWDFTRAGVQRSIDETLQRTGLDRLDIVYLHDPDEHWEEASTDAIEALVDLRDSGTIGAIGVGMNQSEMPTRFLRETPADLVMLAGRYTLLEQDALDDVLVAAEEFDKSIVAVGVFNSGLLSREQPSGDLKYNYRDAPRELVERAGAIAEVCRRHGTSLPAAAIAFPLAHPRVVNVTLGMRNAEQVERNMALYSDGVPVALWADLKAEGLLRADAPTPSA